MSKGELVEGYDKKIAALKDQLQRILGGIEVLERLKQEAIEPKKEKEK